METSHPGVRQMISYGPFFDELQKIAEQSPYGRQLQMGEKVEEEHKGTIGWLKKHPEAPPKAAFRSIAADHLDEDRKYYTHLKEMEDKYKDKKAQAFMDELAKIGAAPSLNWVQQIAQAVQKNIHRWRQIKPKAKTSTYAYEQTGEGGDPMQTSEGTVRG